VETGLHGDELPFPWGKEGFQMVGDGKIIKREQGEIPPQNDNFQPTLVIMPIQIFGQEHIRSVYCKNEREGIM